MGGRHLNIGVADAQRGGPHRGDDATAGAVARARVIGIDVAAR
jgi:hypothetical protein